MIARTSFVAIIAMTIAGVTLDRLDRKRVMIASDVLRAFDRAYVLCFWSHHHQQWLLYVSERSVDVRFRPFLRAAVRLFFRVLPIRKSCRTRRRAHSDHCIRDVSIGTMLGGVSTMQLAMTGRLSRTLFIRI